jgi:NAD(P)-dependent dehydrogenase (short-subunit alcohol dehydrogenase family)
MESDYMKVVLITGLEKEFNKKLAGVFAKKGYKVYAISTETDNESLTSDISILPSDLKKAAEKLQNENQHIDIYIDTSDERSEADNFNVISGINDQVIRDLYEANVIRPMAMLEVFFPFLENGQEKRLCYITSADASINETRGTDGYGYRMAKAGLHNFLQITRNALAQKNYTIRVYDPCYGQNEISAEMAAEAAFNYFTRGRGVERGDPLRDDETNLVFRDAYGRQHSW